MPSGAASWVIHDYLCGPPREVEALALFPNAAYLKLEDGFVMALVTHRGVKLPNAMVLPFPLDVPTAVVGDGAVAFDDVRVTVERWWDPKPFVAWCPRADRVAELAALLEPIPEEFQAFAADPVGEAPGLIGLGPGLTPAGDDLVGACTAALELRAARRLHEALSEICLNAKTTALSATLLRCAARAEVAAPVGQLLRSVFGNGEVEPALAKVLRIGATSGRHLAYGVLIGMTVRSTLP